MGWNWKGKKASVQQIVVEDPYKIPVSTALSSYLTNRVGKGLPRYGSVGSGSEGQSLYEPLDPQAYNIYQNFLSMSPDEWYTKGVQEPTMKAMREEIPNIEEGWAGGLRGSGRFSDVEDYMQDTSETLAEGRYKAELEIPQTQFAMAQSYSAMRNNEKMLDYQDWIKSLPENNPVLGQALQFLAGPTGRDVLTYMDPGVYGEGNKWLDFIVGTSASLLTTSYGGQGQNYTGKDKNTSSGYSLGGSTQATGANFGSTYQTGQGLGNYGNSSSGMGTNWSPYLGSSSSSSSGLTNYFNQNYTGYGF